MHDIQNVQSKYIAEPKCLIFGAIMEPQNEKNAESERIRPKTCLQDTKKNYDKKANEMKMKHGKSRRIKEKNIEEREK